MTAYADGQYDRTKPWTAPPAYTYLRPWASNEERLTQQALDAARMPADEILNTVRAPLPIELFPPRFGYRNRALGICDVINVDRDYRAPSNYSGTDAGYQATSRNAGTGTW